ncbi:MAG: hypothetical protein WC511_01445 [Candidatus Pacearchaeota archaeon]|jgi:hypothetical protein
MAADNEFIKNKFVFDVIGIDWNSMLEKQFTYARKFNEGMWEPAKRSYGSLTDVARSVAKDMVSTNSLYGIISEPSMSEIDNQDFQLGEGLHGYSESSNQIRNIRKLSQDEMKDLGRILIREIELRKQSLSFSD